MKCCVIKTYVLGLYIFMLWLIVIFHYKSRLGILTNDELIFYLYKTAATHKLAHIYITLPLFRLQAKMGYKEGMGLGKEQQGRTEIVEASNQRGRRGLGLRIRGLEPSKEVDWNFELEEVKVVHLRWNNETLVTGSLFVKPVDFKLYWPFKLKFYFQIIEKEEISWIPTCAEPVPNIEIMRKWKEVGKVSVSPDASFTYPYVTSVYRNHKMSFFFRKS